MNLQPLKIFAFLFIIIPQIFSQVIIINEFHAKPVSGQIEFVELINRDSVAINMENWRIADNRDGTNYRLPTAIVLPGEFVVIASDYSLAVPPGAHYLIPLGGLPSRFLNNSGDDIRLFAPDGTIIDSLTYDSSWDVVSGFSLEKVWLDLSNTVDNWKASKDSLGTPGDTNSVAPLNIDGAPFKKKLYLILFSLKSGNLLRQQSRFLMTAFKRLAESLQPHLMEILLVQLVLLHYHQEKLPY